MYIPKKYGQSKTSLCPFCQKVSVAENPQGIPVCSKHAKTLLPELKCLCGSWLEIRKGKWGPYFNCISCGNLNFKKVMEFNPLPKEESRPDIPKKIPPKAQSPKEITVTSNDPNYFD